MNLSTRALAGAAAIAVVLVGGALILRPGGTSGVAATPPPSASPSRPASSPAASVLARTDLEKNFASTRYGYVVSYLPGWRTTQATKTWIPGTVNLWGSGYNDELKGTDIRFSGAAQMLEAGQTSEQWLAIYAGGADPATWPTTAIGGATGRIDADGTKAAGGTIQPGGRMFDAVVISGRFAFNFNMDGNVDRATFDAVLSTIRLPDVPALDTGFVSPLGGYSIQRPSTWTARAATTSWTSGYETQSFSDHISSPQSTQGTSMAIDGTSMKLPAGMTFEAWFAGYDADRVLGTACGGPSMNEDITIDGAVGHLDVHCATHYLEAVVPTGGRVYVFTMFTPFSRPLFETLLSTVDLTPATAAK